MITKMFAVRKSHNRLENLFQRFITEKILSFMATFIFELLHESFVQYSVFDRSELEAFFHLGSLEKLLYRNLVRYIDVQGNYSRRQMEIDFLAAISTRNIFIRSIAFMGLSAHAIYSPLTFLPFLKKFFDEARRDYSSSSWLKCAIDVLVCILDRDPTIDEVFDFFVRSVETYQEHHKNI